MKKDTVRGNLLMDYKSPFFVTHPAFFRVYILLLTALAFVWRRMMWRTTFIAITGSVGKTTAKDCVGAITSRSGATIKSRGTANWFPGVQRSVLRVRPWHRFAVIEVGAGRRGAMRLLAALVRPDIALILSVRREHTDEFPTPEDTANEKGWLAQATKPSGCVVLNGDDPYVRGIAARSSARVRMFGASPDNSLWFDDVSAIWPSTLRFRARTANGTYEMKTELVGAHWVTSVVGAIGVALECGLEWTVIQDGLASCSPYPGRMLPVTLPNGAVFLRDEYGSAPDSFTAALAVVASAQAARKVVVLSQISEVEMTPAECYRYLGAEAARVADLCVFIGNEYGQIGRAAAISAGLPVESGFAFDHVKDAALFLRRILGPGDLVLLKGRMSHHLSRVFFAQIGDVECWMDTCERRYLCDECPEFRLHPLPSASSLA